MSDEELYLDNYDILEVNAEPVVIPSIIGSPEFETRVLNVLAHCLAKGWKMVAAHTLAQHFKVDQRELEEYLDNNPKFEWQSGKSTGVYYYCMAKKEGTYPIDSDDFKQKLIQILREDAKPWKGVPYLAKSMQCKDEDFVKWADVSTLLIRKPSQKNKDQFLYALLDRVGGGAEPPKEEKKQEEKKPKADKKQKNSPNSSITDEERFALAQLHLICSQMLNVMDFYANRLAIRHTEAFSHLTKAEKDLRAGVALLQADLKVEDKRLTPLDKV